MKQNDGRIIWKNQSDLKLILTINEFIEKHGIKLTTFFIHVYLSQPYIYGDGGSRTRVQTHRHLKIYVHSQLI